MLSSIHPLGERGKGNRFVVTAASFVVGAVAGGAATGAVLGVLGLVATSVVGPTAAIAAVALMAAAAAVCEFRGQALPSVPRQVDENWLTEYRGWVYGAGFGFQLGAGVLTYITTAATYVVLTTTVLAGSLPGSVAVGVTFGLVRGLTVLPAGRITTPDTLVSFHRRLQRTAPAVRRTSTVALAALSLAAGAAVLAA